MPSKKRVILISSDHGEEQEFIDHLCQSSDMQETLVLWEEISPLACARGWESPSLKLLASAVYAVLAERDPSTIPEMLEYRGLRNVDEFWYSIESIFKQLGETQSPRNVIARYSLPVLDRLLESGSVYEIFSYLARLRDTSLLEIIRCSDHQKIIAIVGNQHIDNLLRELVDYEVEVYDIQHIYLFSGMTSKTLL